MSISINALVRQIQKYVYRYTGENLRSTLALLSLSARKRLLLLSLSQVFLAILEVLALGILTLLIGIGLSTFTNIEKERAEETIFVSNILSSLSTESKVIILFSAYVVLTLTKTLFSALVTMKTLTLLASQAAEIGTKINTSLYAKGMNIIRFGRSQENLSSITGSIDSLLVGYLGAISQLSGDLATILMVCFALVVFDYETAILLFFLFSLLIFVLHKYINTVASNLSQDASMLASNLNRKTLDSWLIYRELLLAQKVSSVLKPAHQLRMRLAHLRARLSFLPSLSKYIFELFLIVSALFVTCVQLWINGASEAINSFALIIAASARLLPALLRLQGNLLTTKQSIGGGYFARRILEEMAKENDVIKESNKYSKDNGYSAVFDSSVNLKNVSFSYPDSNKNALKDVSLTVKNGTFVAITGASGSGKSTLVDLLLGFLQPTRGSISIGGMVPSVAREIWPGKIAYVPQDVQIVEGTILENITLSPSKEYNPQDLKYCLEVVGLQEDVKLLQEGIKTVVGERGTKLSGGQRQRIGIARALYTHPKLIVLDEATSSLDPITEKLISNVLYKNFENRTIIVVAHRLSTVMNADQIIYLKSGRVAASGTFEELKRSEPEFLKQAELSGL